MKNSPSIKRVCAGECQSVHEEDVLKYVEELHSEVELSFYSDGAIELDWEVWQYIYPDTD